MSGVISDNTVRSSGVVAPLTSATLDANNPAVDTNPTDGLGTKWVNTTSGQIFICIDATTDANEWMGQTISAIQPRIFCAGGNKSITGHAGVGKINVIEYINPGTLGDAIDFGDLLYADQYFTGTSNGVTDRGVFAGGTGEASPTNMIEYITCSTLGNTIDFGNLTAARHQPGACSNGTSDRGCWSGGGLSGVDNPTNIIDYITISSTGNAADLGDLIVARDYTASLSNGTNDRGINASGRESGGSPQTQTIDYWTISTHTGTASDFGDLTNTRMAPATCSNDTNNRGLFMGGSYGATYGNEIDYITINSTGNASDFGDLAGADPAGYPTMNGARGHPGGSSNGTAERGFCFGGYTYTGPGGTESWYKQIEYVTISTPGNSSAFGSLTNMIYGPGNCSNTAN